MPDQAPKLFWIAPKWPLPAEDGARRATSHLLQGLAPLGIDIHLCAIVPRGGAPDPSQAVRELGVRSVSIVRREPSVPWEHLRNLALHPGRPLTVAPYMARAVARQVEEALAAHGGRVVFDGLHAAGWAVGTSLLFNGAVYRAHNVESDLWERGAARSRNPLKAAFLRRQAALVRAFEGEVCRRSELVAAVSREDERRLGRLYRPARSCLVPIGMPLPGLGPGGFPRQRRLLFIGRLDWEPNREGLRWFLREVWPEAAREASDLRLTVAGAGDGAWLGEFAGLERVEILGRVPDVAPLYRDAAASIVPLFFGSGTRVKAIEASAYGRPCISTALGVEGIGLEAGESYLRAEGRDEWIAALRGLGLGEAERMGAKAREWVEREFEMNAVGRRFWRELGGDTG